MESTICRVLPNVSHNRKFGFFQICYLAGQNRLSGEVSVTGVEASCYQLRTSLQVNEANLRRHAKFFAVTALEGGAGQHGIFVGCDPTFDCVAQRFKPRGSIRIGESDTLSNLLDIGRGMKIIGIGELPAQLVGQKSTYGRFSGAYNPHDDDDHA